MTHEASKPRWIQPAKNTKPDPADIRRLKIALSRAGESIKAWQTALSDFGIAARYSNRTPAEAAAIARHHTARFLLLPDATPLTGWWWNLLWEVIRTRYIIRREQRRSMKAALNEMREVRKL